MLRSCSRCSKRVGDKKHEAGEASQQTAFPTSTRGCTRCPGTQQHPEQQPQLSACPDRRDIFLFYYYYFLRNPVARIPPNFGTENNVGQRPLAHTQPAPRGGSSDTIASEDGAKPGRRAPRGGGRGAPFGGFHVFIYLFIEELKSGSASAG